MIGPAVAVTVTLAVANIMSNPVMSSPHVEHDTRALFSLSAAVVCATEIEPPNYRRTFRRTARASGYTTAGLSSPNPVAVRRTSHYRTATVRVRKLSDGVEGISPDRYATVVRLARPGEPSLVVVCTHLVSRAWTHVERSTPLRRELWRTAARKLRRIVDRWHRRGAIVVVAGDLNRRTSVRWGPRSKTVANAGLLQIAVVAAPGSRAVRTGSRTIPGGDLFTDHPIARRTVRITTP